MAGAVTRGTTFTTGQKNVTVAQFNPLLTSATLANVDRDNVKMSIQTPATRGASAPNNPQASELWQDGLHNFLMAYIGGAWAFAYAYGLKYTLFASSDSVSAGNFLAPSTAGVLTKALAVAPFTWFAVATADVAPGGAGVAIMHGVVQVTSTGTINAGEAVIASSTDGTVQSAAAAGSGYGPRILGVALTAASGGYAWIHLRR